MSDSPDAQLQLKKRARRRLVGAVAFAGLAAIILPMVMDEEPKQQVQDVQIRIPGQDQAPFAPNLKPATAEKKNEPVSVQRAPAAPSTVPAEKAVEKSPEKTPEKPAPAAKLSEKELAKPADKAAEKPANGNDAQRAAAILGGKSVDTPAPVNGNGQFVILIGAFANPANVKQLQTKIGELGVRVYTEPLDTPGGRKTRVRAGPFPSQAAAQKALEKIKRIGVNGVIAAKQ
ncbi:SPOR domain-containing protein [Propionivibrio sp.]|uniref:SPOR domain-containing protein n=1 Tax=Propionivibrio sp. TaxID=2212460 RepID=UPI00272E6686|nr:SPOR domain-containing protein [Propionivibrio sp.]